MALGKDVPEGAPKLRQTFQTHEPPPPLAKVAGDMKQKVRNRQHFSGATLSLEDFGPGPKISDTSISFRTNTTIYACATRKHGHLKSPHNLCRRPKARAERE